MAVVTVTGGAAQPVVRLSFDASPSATEARSLGYLVSKEFGGSDATYVSPSHNASGLSSAPAGGYVVVSESGTTNFLEGAKAIAITANAVVYGGAEGGQQVLAQGNMTYATSHDGSEVVAASGSNTFGLFSGANTVYGGSGSDTVNNLATFNGHAQASANVVYAGTGATTVNNNTADDIVSVTGALSSTALLTVNNGDSASYVYAGFGRLIEQNAAGTVFGGAAGNNIIIESRNAPATITGGGTNDYIETYVAGTVITAADDGTVVNVRSGGETVNSGFGTTTINIGAGSGTVAVNAGSGAFNISVASGSVSFAGGVGNGTIEGGSGPVTISGGQGTLYAAADSGYLQGGTNGANTIIGGSGATTLVGAGNGDYLQAGSGNTSLVGTSGAGQYSLLVAGSGSDTLVGNTVTGGSTNFDFSRTDGSHIDDRVDHFNAATVAGSLGDNIFFATAADASYAVQNAYNSNGNLYLALNTASTIVLSSTMVDATGRIVGTDQTLAQHIKSFNP